MPVTKPLPDTARRALLAAAERRTRSVLPLPPDVPVHGAVRQRVLAGLISSGLIEEIPAPDASSTWRTDETGRGIALRVTEGGLTAIGRAPAVAPVADRARRTAAATTRAAKEQLSASPAAAGGAGGSGKPPAPGAGDGAAERQPGGKLGTLLMALASDAGATLSELVTLTGWQPHTTRAALTRLRQRGYALERAERDGRKAYRINAGR